MLKSELRKEKKREDFEHTVLGTLRGKSEQTLRKEEN
jgi:hypothetical protein